MCTTRSGRRRRVGGQRERRAERARRPRPATGVDVDQRHLDARDAGRAAGPTQQPTMPAPTTATRSPTQRRGVPQRVDRGLDGAGEHGPGRRHVVGHDGRRRRPGRRTPSGAGRGRRPCGRRRSAGPGLDDPDVEVAVLHRAGEVALLERRPHRGVLARPARRRGRPASRCPRLTPGAQRCAPGRRPARGRAAAPAGSRPTPGSRTQNARACTAIARSPSRGSAEPAGRPRGTVVPLDTQSRPAWFR